MQFAGSADIIKSSIKAAGVHLGDNSDVICQKCAILCDQLSLDASEVVNNLEAFLLEGDDNSLTLQIFGKFELYLRKHKSKKSADTVKEDIGKPPLPKRLIESHVDESSSKKISFATNSSPGISTPFDQTKKFETPNNNFATASSPMTPMSQQSPGMEQTSTSAPVVGAYKFRQGSGSTVQSHNPALETRGVFEASTRAPLGNRCRVTLDDSDFDHVNQRYRYMFTTLDERSQALDRHLHHMQQQMCAFASISESDLQPNGIPSQDVVWVCGRICCSASLGRINKSSIVLEGSRRESGGRRVQLEVQEVDTYSLFPGQIVLVEGVNSDGRKLVAKRIIEGIPCALPRTPPVQLKEFHHSKLNQHGQALSVIIAAGPFTTSDNLDYEPLSDLLVKVLNDKPDVVVLVGPFVDVTHPQLAGGDVIISAEDDDGSLQSHSASYEVFFTERIIRDQLAKMFNSEADFGGRLATQLILIPSLLDAHHEFVFPQPPFGDRDAKLQIKSAFFEEPLGVLNVPFSDDNDPMKRVHLLSNPCMFRINEVLFGVTSNDVLFSLSSDEVSQNMGNNRLARLAAHVLQQQSFCPQFPVPSTTPSQVDMRQARHWQMKDLAPDVLILPSKLTQLGKEVLGSLVVNPGTLAKGGSGGTYAELSINVIKEDELRDAILAGGGGDNAAPILHCVAARSNLKIVKI